MSVEAGSLQKRVQQSYLQLSVVAANLNSASDKLSASVTNLDLALKQLNLGVSSWVEFRESHSPDGLYYDLEEIGYTKIGGRWGLAIRTRAGNEAEGDDNNSEQWPFNDAPRQMRIRAISKLPELLERLIKDGSALTTAVNKKAEEIDVVTEAIAAISGNSAQEKR